MPAVRLLVDGTQGDVVYDVDRGTVTLQVLRASVSAAGAVANIVAGGSASAEQQSLSGTLDVEPLSPREILAALGETAPPTTDPDVLERLAASGEWALDGSGASLSVLALQIDDTSLTGTAQFPFGADQPIGFDLELDAIDLDRYLAPDDAMPQDSGDEPQSPVRAESGDDEALPVEGLRSLNLDGRLRAGTVRPPA